MAPAVLYPYRDIILIALLNWHSMVTCMACPPHYVHSCGSHIVQAQYREMVHLEESDWCLVCVATVV